MNTQSIRYLFTYLICLFFSTEILAQDMASKERRNAYLEEILPLLRSSRQNAPPVTDQDKTWLDWQQRTGELPPDFETMPSIPFLPDPLMLGEGTINVPITTMDQWEQKRDTIKRHVMHWLAGSFPEKPAQVDAKIISERIEPSGVKVQLVELHFGPGNEARLTMELLIPPGEGPFPVFMTQWNHRGWAEVALRRGYIGCVYAGADSKDDTQAYAALYPEYDFATLMKRAWGGMRAVDYLHTRSEVDTARIAITGHSRNGKQSLLAAAFDDRIKAVISSSGGTAAENSFRFTDDRYDNESLDEISANFPHWLHPRLRFFHGREHKLPIDQNLLMALVAPRALMLSSATTEGQGSPWGIEQNYHSLSRVYDFLEADDKLSIRLRQGRHGTMARDIEAYVDFLDKVFGRNDFVMENRLFYQYTFENWKEKSGENIDPLSFPERDLGSYLTTTAKKRDENSSNVEELNSNLTKNINWWLGDEPPGAKAAGPFGFDRPALSNDYLADVIGRERIRDAETLIIGPYNALADYQYGYLHIPKTSEGALKTRENGRIPVVIFLHEYAYSTGFGRRSAGFIEQYLSAGFAVLTLDMIGFGTRIEEGTFFYDRYPSWSKMGKMVADVRAAVDALGDLEILDQSQLYLSGYSLGGTVALLTASLDDRIAGLAVSSAFTPLRTASEHVEGLRAYSHLHGLMPRLGFFEKEPTRLPVDFPDVIAAIAPNPILILAPQLDRHADIENIRTGLDPVRQAYQVSGAAEEITVEYPMEVNRLSLEQQKKMVDWVVNQLDKKK